MKSCLYDVVIGGLKFQGILGPTAQPWCDAIREGVAFGRATSIRYVGERLEVTSTVRTPEGALIAETSGETGAKARWVVKYRAQSRIDLSPLSDAQCGQVAAEFGITVASDYEDAQEELFFKSPAFKGLLSWIKAHPKQASEFSRFQGYVADWYDRARAGG